jgi:hypothetical protein
MSCIFPASERRRGLFVDSLTVPHNSVNISSVVTGVSMTQHELLSFVDFLHKEMQRRGLMVWPTREILLDNLELNRGCWGPRWRNEFGDTRRTLQRKRWIVEESCSPDCHAIHVCLTSDGQNALQLMNRDPSMCRGHIHVKRRTRCHTRFRYGDGYGA